MGRNAWSSGAPSAPSRGLLMLAAVVALIVLPLLLLASSAAMKRQFDQEHLLRTTLQKVSEHRSQMRSVLIDLQDAETGQRGFLLTGKAGYLAPYYEGKGRVERDLAKLAAPGPGVDPVVIGRLAELSHSKLDELAETIALFRRGETVKSLTIVRSDRGQHYMDAVRNIVATDRRETAKLTSQLITRADASAATTQTAGVVAGFSVVLMLASAAALIGHAVLQRRRAFAKLRSANAEVSALLRTFAIAERVSSSGHWSLAANGAHHWSEGIFSIFGLPVSPAPPAVEEVLSHYAEQDRRRMKDHLAQAFQDRTGFKLQAEITDATGCLKQLCLEADFVDDAEGGALIGVVHDVTAEKLTQRALLQSETRYRHLAENSTDMMLTLSTDFSVLFASPASFRILGYEPADLFGQTSLSLVHPGDLADVIAVFEGLSRAGSGDATFAYRFRGRHRDGAWVWLEGQPRVEFDDSGRPVRYQDVIRDISSRKAAEEALEASRTLAIDNERRYRLLAENATDIIARYDLAGTIRYVSPACRHVIGYGVEDLLGRSTLSLVHPDDQERISKQFNAYRQDPEPEGIHTEHRVMRQDGSVVWLEGRPKLIRDDRGEPVEYHDVMRDVTARKAMETELREARTAAEAAARSKADFLANMSHELRTPLNSVVGFSGLIAEAPELADETRHRAAIVRDSSRALVGIVNDILDFSKFEAEGVKLDPERTDLADLLRSTAELMKPQADSKQIRLNLKSISKVDPVLADAARIRQVVINLLGNAIKFTQFGEVALSLEDLADGGLKVSVSDTGLGIAADRLAHVFDRFAQADASTSRRFGGTGLGLAICRSIVDAMGGEIGVTSSVGVGSTFWFTIHPPRATKEAERRSAPAHPTSPVAGLRILLADDNPFNQELFEALMGGRGFQITFVSNGQEAVEAIAANDYDLAFMDVQMPVMDGLDATRAIRGRGVRLPILALTANVVASQIEGCLEAGMDGHLAKPYTAEAALALITEWTERCPQTKPAPCRVH